MEERVKRFYKLHNNKWFYLMNFNLDVMMQRDIRKKNSLIQYGGCFYNLDTKLLSAPANRILNQSF